MLMSMKKLSITKGEKPKNVRRRRNQMMLNLSTRLTTPIFKEECTCRGRNFSEHSENVEMLLPGFWKASKPVRACAHTHSRACEHMAPETHSFLRETDDKERQLKIS